MANIGCGQDFYFSIFCCGLGSRSRSRSRSGNEEDAEEYDSEYDEDDDRPKKKKKKERYGGFIIDEAEVDDEVDEDDEWEDGANEIGIVNEVDEIGPTARDIEIRRRGNLWEWVNAWHPSEYLTTNSILERINKFPFLYLFRIVHKKKMKSKSIYANGMPMSQWPIGISAMVGRKCPMKLRSKHFCQLLSEWNKLFKDPNTFSQFNIMNLV